MAFQSLQHKEEVKSRAATASHLIGDNDGDDASSSLVHNCTIFLCSLDVRNIAQGGNPLYAAFFSTQGSGGYT